MSNFIYNLIVLAIIVFYIFFRIYKYPNIKCFFGFHNYEKGYLDFTYYKVLNSLCCKRKNCTAYYLKAGNKWVKIRNSRRK